MLKIQLWMHDLTCSVSKSIHSRDDIPQVRYLTILKRRSTGDHKKRKAVIRAHWSHAAQSGSMQRRNRSLTSIGKLIHLRCLYVSFNEITTFPDSVCQALNIFKCFLKQLLKKLQDLTGLRHLIYYAYEDFPMQTQIRRSSILKIYNGFNVSDKEDCRTEEWGHLKNFRT